VLAKEYGQSPEVVENWDEYWFERAAVELHGRSIYERRRDEEERRKRR